MPDFCHLHCHTQYSLLDGAADIAKMMDKAQRDGQKGVALTDHGNMFGAFQFVNEANKRGLKPIIGCEFYLVEDRHKKQFLRTKNENDNRYHQLLLAKNRQGYENLSKLCSLGFIEGLYGKYPRIDKELIEKYHEGLIATSCCIGAEIPQTILTGNLEKAEELLKWWLNIFGEDYYIELQRHRNMENIDGTGMSQEDVNQVLLGFAKKYNVKVICTNDSHYVEEEDYMPHDILLCVNTNSLLEDKDRFRFPSSDFYFKTQAEMNRLFGDVPQALDFTHEILDKIEPLKLTHDVLLPAFPLPPGFATQDDYLRHLTFEGAKRRYGYITPEIEERLNFELNVIKQSGYPGYFLIVQDFTTTARQMGVSVGPGRGSAAGSAVAYCIGITNVDPIKYDLLFERFLNPERVSMPDFDIDFCQDRRDEVIRHVQERYGRDKVAQIITFGKLQARAVLRDTGRVLGMPYGYVDKICKLVPNNPANPVTLAQALEAEPQFRELIGRDEAVAKLVDIATRLEGLYRHASTHAAGVVIGDRPLEELIPLYRDPRSDIPVTGFNMKWVEAAGLVKFDFLGLKTLTVLARAVDLIREGRGLDLDLAELPLDDPETFAMLSAGDTVGVFQLESGGMRDALRQLKPDTFEDIIAVVALYRPGPMDNIPSYIRRKHGEEEPDYLYPTLEPILAETHGIMIYQEQVMQIAQELSGYSLGKADLLRRAMGKKIKEEMDQQRSAFVEGAKARGVPERKAVHIFELVNKFAGYGFNKSHAAAYALVAYQTAYLKANYPVEFLAASMTLDIHSTEKLNTFCQELNRLGIPLLPPDINRSGVGFVVERDPADPASPGAIRFALAAVKNVSEAAMAALVEERGRAGAFTSLDDFATRIDARTLNRRQLENLARAGAFDGLNRNRRQVFGAIEAILRQAAAASQDRASGQMGLFAAAPAAAAPALRRLEGEDWSVMERLKEELDAIGFYLSAHPLDAYAKTLRRLKVASSAELAPFAAAGTVSVAGAVVGKRERTSGKGNRYAFVQLSDSSGLFEVTVFSDVLANCRELLEIGKPLLIKVTVQAEGEQIRCVAQSVEPLEAVAARVPAELAIVIDTPEPIERIRSLLSANTGGEGEVKIVCGLAGETQAEVVLPNRFRVGPAMTMALQSVAGVRDVREL